MNDYFVENPVYSDIIFRRRFRMTMPLFLCIVQALGEWNEYFTLMSGMNISLCEWMLLTAQVISTKKMHSGYSPIEKWQPCRPT